MKLRPVKLITCLLLGVVISVLVAWRCAIVGERETTSREMPRVQVHELWREVVGSNENQDTNELGGSIISAAGSTWYLISDEPEWIDGVGFRPGVIFVVIRRQNGFPARCVEGDTITTTAPPPRYEIQELHGYARTPPISLLTGRAQYGLPIRPLWVGLIINVLFYGVIVWIVWCSLTTVRRRARLDGKRCPKCKHDCRAAPQQNECIICPECGTRIATHNFTRPRMMVRWWMTPFLLPAVASATIWFLGGFDWAWLRFQWRWSSPIITINSLILFALVMWFLHSIGMAAFGDRPPRARPILAAVVAIALTAIAYIPLHALTLWMAR